MSPVETPGSKAVRRIRVRAMMFLVLALIAGTGAVFLIKRYMDRAQLMATGGSGKNTPVVVAAIDIPIATRLTAQHVTVVAWPTKSLSPGVFVRAEEVVGRTVQQGLVKGEPVLAKRLADEKRGTGLAAILGKGRRAMAVKVNQVIGVAGFVQPGDFVDVISTMNPDEETLKALGTKARSISKVFLQNIKVLAVGKHMATEGSKPVKVTSVTLEVDTPQSELLALAARQGAIQLTMRSRIDQESVPTAGTTPFALLSPDEGAEVAETKGPVKVAQAEPRRRRRRAAPKPVKPETPVVEVLRGDRVETRKLRPSPDSE